MHDYVNRIFCGDSSLMREIPDGVVDALVTDPPSGIAFMNLDWDRDKGGREQWIAWFSGVMREAFRVMKPGAHGFVWALPRTSHWTATALEDAGFDVRDIITHLFSSGFPKSQDISRMIDKIAGAERKVVGIRPGHETTVGRDTVRPFRESGALADGFSRPWMHDKQKVLAYHMQTAPATDDAKKWDGWGTSLKPASEHWILIRKPLSEKTIVANVLKHSCGALNIEESRVPMSGNDHPHGSGKSGSGNTSIKANVSGGTGNVTPESGRWPANVALSHSPECSDICTDGCAVAELDRQSGVLTSGEMNHVKRDSPSNMQACATESLALGYGDSGGASRFFYVAKPSVSEKNANIGERIETKASPTMGGGAFLDPNGKDKRGSRATKNTHPTVKPLSLMQYLIRMITPPGGIVLDNFAGSGTTLIAADSMGFRWIGCEQNPEYVKIIEARLSQRSLFSA